MKKILRHLDVTSSQKLLNIIAITWISVEIKASKEIPDRKSWETNIWQESKIGIAASRDVYKCCHSTKVAWT